MGITHDKGGALMLFLVKVTVNLSTLPAFGAALKTGTLDRTCIRSDTWCLKDEPAVGFSVWEAKDRADFEAHFKAWRAYYKEVEALEVIPPMEAMTALASGRA